MIAMLDTTELILGLRPANERQCYFVTTSLIGWAQTENQPCTSSNGGYVNSSVPGKSACIFQSSLIGISPGRLRWCPRMNALGLSENIATWVLVMAWCHHTTGHNLSLCWPSCISSYDVTRPQCVKTRSTCIILLQNIIATKYIRWQNVFIRRHRL